jgi:bacteriophage CI repressor helix-turn-helix domain
VCSHSCILPYCDRINLCLANKKGAGNEKRVYYNIAESGARLKKLRNQEGLSREVLAETLGISSETVRRIERGKNGTSIDTLVLFAEYFKVSLDYIVCGCENNRYADIFCGLEEKEILFLRKMAESVKENMGYLKG